MTTTPPPVGENPTAVPHSEPDDDESSSVTQLEPVDEPIDKTIEMASLSSEQLPKRLPAPLTTQQIATEIKQCCQHAKAATLFIFGDCTWDPADKAVPLGSVTTEGNALVLMLGDDEIIVSDPANMTLRETTLCIQHASKITYGGVKGNNVQIAFGHLNRHSKEPALKIDFWQHLASLDNLEAIIDAPSLEDLSLDDDSEPIIELGPESEFEISVDILEEEPEPPEPHITPAEPITAATFGGPDETTLKLPREQPQQQLVPLEPRPHPEPPRRSKFLTFGAAALGFLVSISALIGVVLLYAQIAELKRQTEALAGQEEQSKKGNALQEAHNTLATTNNQLAETNNTLLNAQNKHLQAQLAHEEHERFLQRRSQLISTLYDYHAVPGCEEPDVNNTRNACPFQASQSTRRGALQALVDLELERHAQGRTPSKPSFDLESVNVPKAKLSGRDLASSRWNNADLFKADLSQATLTNADMSGANLDRADLHKANLAESSMRGTLLRGANLAGVNLKQADLSGARFDGADLSGADLSGANLESASFMDSRAPVGLPKALQARFLLAGPPAKDAVLKGTRFKGARCNRTTRFPPRTLRCDLRSGTVVMPTKTP